MNMSERKFDKKLEDEYRKEAQQMPAIDYSNWDPGEGTSTMTKDEIRFLKKNQLWDEKNSSQDSESAISIDSNPDDSVSNPNIILGNFTEKERKKLTRGAVPSVMPWNYRRSYLYSPLMDTDTSSSSSSSQTSSSSSDSPDEPMMVSLVPSSLPVILEECVRKDEGPPNIRYLPEEPVCMDTEDKVPPIVQSSHESVNESTVPPSSHGESAEVAAKKKLAKPLKRKEKLTYDPAEVAAKKKLAKPLKRKEKLTYDPDEDKDLEAHMKKIKLV